MPTVTELHEKRGQLVTEARAALNAITTNTDEARTAELEQRHDKFMADLDALDTTIAREERTAKAEKSAEEYRSKQRPTGANIEVPADGSGENGEQREVGKAEAEYRDAFMAVIRAGGATGDLTAEQRTLLRKGFVEERVQVAGTAASGGYTVPVDLAREIVKSMKDWGPMYDGDIVREIMTGSGNEFDIPTNDDTASSAATLAEGADPLDDNSGDVLFGQKRLDAYVDATPWVKISFELMQDSVFNLEAFLAEALGERLGRRCNVRLTTGSGVSQPNGIVTASAQGKIAALGTAIAPNELIDLQHSVNQAYRRSPKARWMFADSTLMAIRKMVDGQGNYLWQMGDIRIGAPAMLLDHPYSINDDVPAIAAAARAVIFGDFSKYWVRKVGSPLIGTVRERFWPKIGLAGLVRYDGELVDTAAVKHLRLA